MKIKKGIIVIAAAVIFLSVVAGGIIISKAGNERELLSDTSLGGVEGYCEGEVELSAEEEKWVEENVVPLETVEEVADYLENNQIDGIDNSEIEADSSSNEVDNSDSSCFPAIGNQGSTGSCVAWAVGYYQLSYMMNKVLDRSASDDKNVFSPAWLYNLANMGMNDGSTYVDILRLLIDIGAVSLDSVPCDTDSENYITNLHATESNYLEAFKYQIGEYYSIAVGDDDNSGNTPITGPQDSDLDAIKYALDKGEVLTASTKSKRWIISQIEANDEVPENEYYIGENIITRSDANVTSGHRIAVVGYNDNIWVDINENGIVEQGEKGAFKIANSWGDSWDNGNKGFIWASYDSLNRISSVASTSDIDLGYKYRCSTVYNVIGIVLKESQEPSNCYLEFKINTSTMSSVGVKVKAVDPDGEVYEYASVPFTNSAMQMGLGSYNPDGYAMAGDGVFMVDLDNVIPNITPDTINDYTWSVTFQDIYSDDAILVIKNLYIIDNKSDIKYGSSYSSGVSINNSSTTLSVSGVATENYTTIYYSGYSNPYIHYKVGDGSWTTAPGVAMEASSEVSGYTHKYVVDMGDATSVIACFNNGSNSWDNNNSSNYSFALGTYGVKNQVVTDLSNKIIDVTATPTPTYSPDGSTTTIYYKGYSNPYIHYKVGDGSWTTAPGVAMEVSSEVSGYTHKVIIDLGTATKLTACFNNGSGSWDSNNGSNYLFGLGTYTFKDGTITKITSVATTTPKPTATATVKPTFTPTPKPTSTVSPTSTPKPTATVKTTSTPDPTNNICTIYYKGYSNPYIHYKINGSSWTTAPGVKFEASTDMSGYTHKIVINMGTATQLTACFNNGSGDWDSNNGSNYSFGVGTYKYSDGTIKKVTITTTSDVTIYYKGYSNPYIHYRVGSGSWTTAPGVAMTETSEKSGYTHVITVDLGNKDILTACFNNGSGSWDSNNGTNYTFTAGTYTYSSGVITSID